jgi:hypothetical protein
LWKSANRTVNVNYPPSTLKTHQQGCTAFATPFKMPNHHIVGAGDAEKGYDYGKQTHTTEEPFVHGAATVGEATGRGGDTHRGLKSRHIQFLYAAIGDIRPVTLLIQQQSSRWCNWNRSLRWIRCHSCPGRSCPAIHGLPGYDDCRMECHEQLG